MSAGEKYTYAINMLFNQILRRNLFFAAKSYRQKYFARDDIPYHVSINGRWNSARPYSFTATQYYLQLSEARGNDAQTAA
jgi:hypothetical protein